MARATSALLNHEEWRSLHINDKAEKSACGAIKPALILFYLTLITTLMLARNKTISFSVPINHKSNSKHQYKYAKCMHTYRDVHCNFVWILNVLNS